MITPPSLHPGDRIAILAPASAIKREYVDGAARVITELGYEPVVMPTALARHGSFSGTIAERADDLRAAIADPSISAILCARGGYGCIHLVELIEPELLRQHPKWIIGFSDISILHAIAHRAGIVSVHASMCKHLAEFGADDDATHRLFDILTGTALPRYDVGPHPFNRTGTARGTLLGGNMATFMPLIGTNIDLVKPGSILFIEDVGEAVYKVDRMMYQLRVSGRLHSLAGLIVGQFTEYNRDVANDLDIYDVVARATADCSFPIAFDFPIGHIDANQPIPEGATATLSVTPAGASLTLTP